MKKFLVLSLFVLGACTAQMEHNFERDKKAWNKFDFKDMWVQLTGIDEIPPEHLPREIDAPPIPPKMDCLSGSSHQRVITSDGINDEASYKVCEHAEDVPMVPVKRWAGK